jgi:(R,R)-butanediol dehydrogenase/meso-butanediol dehydrogenase/diacetyl reductase
MKTGLLTGTRKFMLCDVPEPQLVAGGAIVDITLCGICGSDVSAYKSGDKMGIAYPPALCGHEWMGIVRSVADNVSIVSEGDRVLLGSPPPCGTNCPACRQGRFHACELAVLSMLGGDGFSPHSGGFAPRQAVDARRLVRLPDNISDVQAAMAEPATVVAHGIRKSSLLLGDRVAILGAGPIGLFAAQIAKANGAGQVIVIEPDEHRRQMALTLGADFAWAPGEEAAQNVADLTGNLGLDRVYDCAGVPATLEAATTLVRRCGMVMIIGFATSLSPADTGAWLMKEISVHTSLSFNRADTLAVLDLMANGGLKVGPMHSSTIGLSEAADAFEELAAGSGKLKILVDPRD